MGYTTYFHGQISVNPPLNEVEREALNAFSNTRRMSRKMGPYYTGDNESDVIDYNQPDPGQPGLWCQWVCNDEGTAIEWDEGEKFYYYSEWLNYIRSHFIVLNAAKHFEPATQSHWQPHSMNGQILAVGEDATNDIQGIKVDEQGVWTCSGSLTESTDDMEYDSNRVMDHILENPESVSWSEWRLMPPFPDGAVLAKMEGLIVGEATIRTDLLSAPSKTL